MFFGAKPSIHLIGIGGSGMSGIAEVLIGSGFQVQGSDIHRSATTERLEKLGARIFIQHARENVSGATCVVVSSAVDKSNPEWKEAIRLSIPVILRAEMLAELMRLKMGIAIAGSHGKTTTTSMTGQILRPLDPTVVVGGRLQQWNASSIVGGGNTFVIEADESDRSFLKFSPVISVVTNIDREHLDNYRNIDDIKKTFLEFLNKTAFFGMNWISADCPHLMSLRKKITKPTRTFGFSEEADLKIVRYSFENRKSQFELEEGDRVLGPFELSVVGEHNLKNAAASVGVALSMGLNEKQIAEGLKHFIPADRRLQIHAETADRVVLEDYGHHPTEIAATLQAVRLLLPNHSLSVVFQPHRYSRTQALWNEFGPSFSEARIENLFLLPIYAAHEEPIEGISSETLAATFDVKRFGAIEVLKEVPQVDFLVRKMDSSAPSKSRAILILGAGPLTSLAQALARCVEREGAALKVAAH